MTKNIKTFRKGAKVRYIGNNPSTAAAWRNSIQTVVKKTGNTVVGYFPMKYGDGSIHCCQYSVHTNELEIVTK